jgi:hypothetical protein
VADAPLDDRDVDPRQRQFTAQHQARRATSGDHRRMLGHPHSVSTGFSTIATVTAISVSPPARLSTMML